MSVDQKANSSVFQATDPVLAVGGKDANGNLVALQLDASDNLKTTTTSSQPDPTATTGTISVVDAATTSASGAPGQTIISGTPTANSSVVATLSGEAVVRVSMTTTNFNGTTVFEKSDDGGTTYYSAGAFISGAGSSVAVSSATFSGSAVTQKFFTTCGALTQFRIRCSVRSAGTLTVTIQPGYGASETASALLAGDNHTGLIGGSTAKITVNPTVTAGSYSSGYVLGGVQTIANAVRATPLSGVLHRLMIRSKTNIQATMHVYLFSQNPSNGTYTDNQALTWNATDFGFVIGMIVVPASVWYADNSKAVADLPGLNEVLVLAGTSLYALAIIQGTFTPGGTTEYGFDYNILQD